MPKSKAEHKGEFARQQGESRSSSPYNKWFPSDADKRNHVDWLIGWDRENEKRQQMAKK